MHILGIDIDKVSLLQSESDSQIFPSHMFAVFSLVFLRLQIQKNIIPNPSSEAGVCQ